MSNTRRRFLTMAAGSASSLALPKTLKAAVFTPRTAEGPFYPTESMRFGDVDNDLVKIAGAVRQAGGEIFTLQGRVLTRDGEPRIGARVEIWQVDSNARYLHTGDRETTPRDTGFQGFGQDITGADGRYSFRTIKPVPYPGRTPHIHVKVFADDLQLTTQLYIAGHSLNARDGLFRRMSKTAQKSVEMTFVEKAGTQTAEVDLAL